MELFQGGKCCEKSIVYCHAEIIAMLQLSDPVLKSVLTKGLISATVKVCGTEYVLHNDMLYQGEKPSSGRLVVPVPLSCRPLVLHLAHTIPWADT